MPKRSPLISVVVPCWNYGMFLRECLDSLFNQTMKPMHIIVTDDASTDDSNAIAWDYLRRVHNKELEGTLTIFRNDTRLGTIENENRAAAAVQTPWMFFLDADDKLDLTYIEKVHNIIEAADDKLFVVYSDMQKFGLWEGDWICSDWDPEALRQGNYINGHSVFRKDLFDKVGGLKDNGHFEDHWMWCEMMDLDPAYYGKRIPEKLVWYRRHDRGHRTDKSDISTRS